MHLRRAVSVAYYAVFHLLIFESTQYWDNPALRTALGRGYDHGIMRTTSNRVLDSREFPYPNEDPKLVAFIDHDGFIGHIACPDRNLMSRSAAMPEDFVNCIDDAALRARVPETGSTTGSAPGGSQAAGQKP
jgi:hypothetical protein